MAQVKKEEVLSSILDVAYDLFRLNGYVGTSMAQIASGAGISTSNIYVYFSAKLDVLAEIYGRWLDEQLDRLESDTAEITDPGDRLRRVLRSLWHTIPASDNAFAASWIQAVALAGPEEQEIYRRDLLLGFEQRLSRLIVDCLPDDRKHLVDNDVISHVLIMAFDGFALNHRLRGPSRRLDAAVNSMASLLLGDHGPAQGQ